jgi:anti-sigma factor RsiW
MVDTPCPADHELMDLLSTEPDAANLGRHVDTCPRCQERFRRLQAEVTVVRDILSLGGSDPERTARPQAEEATTQPTAPGQ